MKLVIPLAASLLLISCATPQKVAEGSDVAEPRTFRTGSHLPTRDNEVPNVRSEAANIHNSTAAPYVPSGKGGGN